jgi:hypothetical protein
MTRLSSISRLCAITLACLLLTSETATAESAPPPASVASLAFNPDGTRLAIARGPHVSIYTSADWKLDQSLSVAEFRINALAWNHDGTQLAAAEGEPGVAGAIRVWTFAPGGIPTGEPRLLEGLDDSLYGLAFLPDGQQLAAASYDKRLQLWDVASGKPGATLIHHTAPVFGLSVTRNGQYLASAAADSTVKIWSIAEGKRLATLTESTKGLSAVAFLPKDNELVAVGEDRMLRVWSWNGTSAKLVRSAFAHEGAVLAVTVSPDGTILYTAAEDGQVKSWDALTLRELHDYPPFPDWPQALAISPDGKALAVGRFDGRITILNARAPGPGQDLTLFGRQDETMVTRRVSEGPRVPHRTDTHALSTSRRVSKGERLHASPLRVPLLARPAVRSSNQRRSIPHLSSLRVPLLACPAVRSSDRRRSRQTPLHLIADEKPAENKPVPKPAPPQPPRLDNVTPRFVVRGTQATLTFTGQSLWNATGLQIDNADSGIPLDVTLHPGDEKKPNERQGTFNVPADFTAGRPIKFRWQTATGGTDAKTIHVLAFPEVNEKEPNDTFATAPGVTLHATLRGTILSRGDADEWKLEGKQGDEISLQLLGPSLGSALSPVLSVRDSEAKVLLTTRRQIDGEIITGLRLPADGAYSIRIEDRSFTGGGNHFYALHVGKFPVVTDSFPRGLQAHYKSKLEKSDLTVFGFNLLSPAAAEQPQRLATDQPSSHTIKVGTYIASRHHDPVTTPNGPTLNRVRYEVTRNPELVEADQNNDTPQTAIPLTIPSAFNGRISATNGTKSGADVDCISFQATQGQRLTLEVEAARAGSTLDSQFEILDEQGLPVVRATLRCVAETLTVLRDHDSKVPGIRLQAWDDFRPNEYLLLGGEVVRIRLLPLGPDEDVKFFEREGRRLGWLGTTPQAHALSSAAYKVEVHPPGSTFPPTGMPVVPLAWRNDDGGAEFKGDSRILFDVPRDGRYVARISDSRGTTAESHFYRLVLREREEGFRITLNPEQPNLPVGDTLPINVTIERLDGFTGPVELSVDGLPPGITPILPRVPADMYATTIGLRVDPEVAPHTTGSFRVTGRGFSSTGQQLEERTYPEFESHSTEKPTVEQMPGSTIRFHSLCVMPPPDLVTKIEPAFVEITPGQEVRFTATIERRNGLDKRIPVDVLGLPHGLRVLDVGLNGVLINENETSRSFVVVCDPWAPEGDHTFFAAGRIESKGNERHGSTPITIRVKGQ